MRVRIALAVALHSSLALGESVARFEDASVPSPKGTETPTPLPPRQIPSGSLELAARGSRFEQEGRIAEALGAYTEAVRLDGQNGPALLALGRLRHRLGDLREAERLFTAATHLADVAGPAYVERAHLRRDQTRAAEAALDLERAAELLPSDRLRTEELAAWYVTRRAWSPALAAWRRAAAESPDAGLVSRARLQVAALSALAGDLDPVQAGRSYSWTRRALARMARTPHGTVRSQSSKVR